MKFEAVTDLVDNMLNRNLRLKASLLSAAVISFSNISLAACISSPEAKGYRFPVVLNVPPSLWDAPVDRFEAWSFKNGHWQSVAIQLDEKNAEGSYVLEQGQPFTKGTDNGLADGNDEISLKGHELGQNFMTANLTPEVTGHLKKYEKLDVCVENVYAGSVLVGWTNRPKNSPNAVSLYDSATETVTSSAYRYEFNHKRPMLVGEVYLKSNGKEFPVFADSTFMMPIIPSFWLFPGTSFDENDFTSAIECWRSGPVRSIVAVGAKMQKFFSLVKLHLFSELVFYEDFFQIPTQIEMIFDASNFLSFGSGLAYILRYPEGGAWDLNTNLVKLPRSSDIGGGPNGRPKKTARQVSPNGIFRAWGSRPEGSFLAQVRVDPKTLDIVPPPFIVEEPMFDKEPWRSEWRWMKGARGNLGVFLDISMVKKGTYDFALDLMLSNRANDEFTDFRPVNWEWQNL